MDMVINRLISRKDIRKLFWVSEITKGKPKVWEAGDWDFRIIFLVHHSENLQWSRSKHNSHIEGELL